MSIPYTDTGRTQQKRRTRDALVDAARDLMLCGMTPTVENAAAHASISRTTAYRYFANQRELLVAAYPQLGEESLLPADAPDDPAERLSIVLDAYLQMTVDNEAALRAAYALSLKASEDTRRDLVLRQGRVIGWVEDALAPLRPQLSPTALGRLARAIRAAAGIESLIWLCDVGGMSRPQAVKLMKWSAHALLTVALAETGRPASAAPSDPRTGGR